MCRIPRIIVAPARGAARCTVCALALAALALLILSGPSSATNVYNEANWALPFAAGGSEHTGGGPPPEGYGWLAYSHEFRGSDGACLLNFSNACWSTWPWPWFEHVNQVRAWTSFRDLQVTLAGTYSIDVQAVLNGMAGIRVPRAADFWGGADARMVVKVWVKVYRTESLIGGDYMLYASNEFVVYDRMSYYTTETPTYWNEHVVVWPGALSVQLDPQDLLYQPYRYMINVGIGAESVIHGQGGNGGGFTRAALMPDTTDWFGFPVSISQPSRITFVRLRRDAPDTQPPITSAWPTPGSVVCRGEELHLQAQDPPGGYGVAGTYWQLTGGPVQTYHDPIPLTASGNIWFWSVDLVGNTEPAQQAWYSVADTAVAPVQSQPYSGSTQLHHPIALGWGEVAGAGRYRLQVAEDSSYASPLVDREIVAPRDTLWTCESSKTYHWRVAAWLPVCGRWSAWSWSWSFTTDPTVAVQDPSRQPLEFALGRPFPNPARDGVTLELGLPEAEWVTVEVFHLDGRRVATLASGPRSAGTWSLSWRGTGDDGRRLPPGVYFCKARTAGREAVRRVVLLR